MADQKLPFETYFDGRIIATGDPPPEGDYYLLLRGGVVYKTSFGSTAGFADFTDDTTPTTIAATNTWTDINNQFVDRAVTPTLVFENNGFTYVGASQNSPTRIRAAMSATKPDPGSVPYSLGIAINGTPVISYVTVEVTDGIYAFAATEYYHAMQSGDVITVIVQNRFNTDDITLQDGQLSIG